MTLDNPKTGASSPIPYQISGLPYVTASSAVAGTISRIDFPYVTNFLAVKNTAASGSLLVGFTSGGVVGTNRFSVGTSGSFGADFRCKSLFITADIGTVSYEVVAGITLIENRFFPTLASASNGSGSFGYPGL